MSTLDQSFLRAVVVMTGFKPRPMITAQAALLLLGLHSDRFTAADLPAETCNGSQHLAGAATGALISTGMLSVVGRTKSPNPNAKGRKLDVLTLVSRSKARAWLTANNITMPDSLQLCLSLLP